MTLLAIAALFFCSGPPECRATISDKSGLPGGHEYFHAPPVRAIIIFGGDKHVARCRPVPNPAQAF